MVRTAGPAMFWRNGNASGMAYEEASVAGETPDRSKQRKSSGNPTGAEPSVPAPDERDPRLAVAREIPAAREVPEAPKASEVREDQATAVFSTKAVTEAGSADAEGSEGSKGSAEGAESAEAEPKAEESGDARLRAAVAAWVASADEEDPGSAKASAGADAPPGGGSSEGNSAEASEASEADAGGGESEAAAAGESGTGDAAASGDSDAADAADATDGAAEVRSGESGAADGGAEAKASAADSGTAGSAEAESAAGSAGRADGAGASGGAEGSGDGDAADAAAESAAGSADPADGAGASGDAEGSGDAEAAASANAGSAAGAGASGAADAPAGAGDADGSGDGDAVDSAEAEASADSSRSADSADDASTSGDVDEPAGVGGSSGDAEGSGDAEVAAGANAGSAAGAGASGAADAPAGAGDADGSGDGDAVDSAEAEASADSSRSADSADDASTSGDVDEPAGVGGTSGDAGDSADAAPDAADKPAGGEGDPESSGDPEPAADGESSAESPEPRSGGVDQATAVFKALPPKAVDQPTTMLKLGDHKPAAKKPESPAGKAPVKPEAKPEAKPAAKPERESERTSKFVALKPLDNPPSSGASSASGALPPVAETPAVKAPTPEKSSVGPERTTQQPLPPRPPLDLLAELTNTPPPPETPVRTAVRRVKIWTPLVLLLVVVFAVVQAVRPLPTPTLALTAKETVSFEGEKPSMPWPGQGQAAMDVNGIGTFGTSGDQKPVPIASIAKVMTVYLILRDHPLKKGGSPGPDIPVDAAAEKHYETGKSENESVVKVTEGQKISEYEALQAVMLPSANNVAKLLARWDTKSDSEDEFVAKMNKTAKELGMKNTHYTDPSGLDKTTVSTAEDLVKLGRAAMEDPVFNEISRQPSYKDLNGDKQNNFFGLVPTVAIGIKTGTTTAAGGNILFAAEKKVGGETRTIIGAALGQYGKDGVANIDEVTGVTRKLIEAGQGALISKKIVEKGDVVGQVDDGLGGTTPVVATKDVSAAGWSGLTVKLKLGEDGGETIPHSAKAGTKVGVLSVGDGKDGAVEVPVALQKDLTEPGFGAKLQRVG